MSTGVLVMIDRPALGQTGDGPAFRAAAADSPQLRVTDLGATRGDGIFETAAIRNGRVQASREHLDRFARSAAMLDLPAPDPDVYRAAIELGIGLLHDASDASVKYVLTRGDEHDAATGPTGWAFLDASEDFSDARDRGIGIVLLSRGYALDVAETAPWLLQGAKTLSYAVNKAALREAARRGAEDVLFTTTDGYVLEGPTSSVVLRLGDELVTTPPDAGVLPGTTQQGIFEYAQSLGLRTAFRDLRVVEIADADALWLTSSVRLAVAVRAVDGQERPADLELTRQINEYLISRTD
ncbi:D-alanine aminotransferase [Cellulomonas sp. T2.31MG-18]|uniref:aminodeoxychorismate lyase n=1 Tax=Cellulomonas sp. T2.31MG-18 TaxID=3157619 RepID=UPI0035E8F7FB